MEPNPDAPAAAADPSPPVVEMDAEEVKPEGADGSRKRECEPGADASAATGEPPSAKKPKKSKKNKPANPPPDTSEPPPSAPHEMVKIVQVDKEELAIKAEWRPVSVSTKHAAPQMKIHEDERTVTSWKGYRMARATHGTKLGTWYYEAEVMHLGETGHARMGWSTKKADIQAPVGYDQHSFSYRDVDGSKVHKATREPYGESYKEGDVIGFFIHLPHVEKVKETKPKEMVVWKGGVYYIDEQEPPPEPIPGAVMAFTKNGVYQGAAYTDFLEGEYHPAVSLYSLPTQEEGASVRLNFGPDLKYPPPAVDGCPPARPACEMAGEKPPEPPAPAPVVELAGPEGSVGGAAGGAGAGGAAVEGAVKEAGGGQSAAATPLALPEASAAVPAPAPAASDPVKAEEPRSVGGEGSGLAQGAAPAVVAANGAEGGTSANN